MNDRIFPRRMTVQVCANVNSLTLFSAPKVCYNSPWTCQLCQPPSWGKSHQPRSHWWQHPAPAWENQPITHAMSIGKRSSCREFSNQFNFIYRECFTIKIISGRNQRLRIWPPTSNNGKENTTFNLMQNWRRIRLIWGWQSYLVKKGRWTERRAKSIKHTNGMISAKPWSRQLGAQIISVNLWNLLKRVGMITTWWLWTGA